jgi:hypothetical protein
MIAVYNSLKLVLQNDYVAQYCGSGMFIPDPGFQFFNPGSQIQDPGSKIFRISYFGSHIPDPKSRIWICINEFKYFSPTFYF